MIAKVTTIVRYANMVRRSISMRRRYNLLYGLEFNSLPQHSKQFHTATPCVTRSLTRFKLTSVFRWNRPPPDLEWASI